ncbi:uncharacterized protein LOC118195057 isoform X2 [Stegodyphus dumicola]|nr:uncharacterized protein LOC118195057 isoform X2 [Stegodyphus dumicola]
MRFYIGFIFCLMAVLTYAQDSQTKTYFLQHPFEEHGKGILVVATWSVPKLIHCEMHSDKENILPILNQAEEIIEPTVQELVDVINDCRQFLDRNLSEETSRILLTGIEHFSESSRKIPVSNDAKMRISEDTLAKWKSEPHNSGIIFPGF